MRLALLSTRSYFITAALFSLAINLLYLAGPIFMIQITDRVLSSGSETTLMMLLMIVLTAYATLSSLDCLRAQILARAAARMDAVLAPQLFELVMAVNPLRNQRRDELFKDLETLRSFIAGNAVTTLFDFPWTPIYLFIIYQLHPALGGFAILCATSLIGMAAINELFVRNFASKAVDAANRVHYLGEECIRNRDSIHAMGMLPDLAAKWTGERKKLVSHQLSAGERSTVLNAVVKFLRLAMQSGILALGAWLVIERATTTGAMFAASILLGRALQPVEQVVAAWKTFIVVFDATRRLVRYCPASDLNNIRREFNATRPRNLIAVSNVSFSPDGSQKPLFRNISFDAERSDVIGVVGPAGVGKTTLAKLLVGVLIPTSGSIHVAGELVHAHGNVEARRNVGYLPQNIELFQETVAENIARFRCTDSIQIVRAAEMADVHEMILKLPLGYQTLLGPRGVILSGGWQQRIALARAVFGNPNLVVLDEPNSNLDSFGEQALDACIRSLKQQRATVFVVSHRPSMLRAVDKLLVLGNGGIDWYGRKDELIRRTIVPLAKQKSTANARG